MKTYSNTYATVQRGPAGLGLSLREHPCPWGHLGGILVAGGISTEVRHVFDFEKNNRSPRSWPFFCVSLGH